MRNKKPLQKVSFYFITLAVLFYSPVKRKRAALLLVSQAEHPSANVADIVLGH